MGSKALGFEEARAALEEMLTGPARRAILAEVSRARSFDRAARRLRDAMRTHRFEGGEIQLPSLRFVARLDQLTRQEGFHVLNDWDGKADRFNDDTIPVEVANFAERILRPTDETVRSNALSVLLDYYLLHILALLAMRAWDDGDPNANLAAVTTLLDHLQGEHGSGHRFALNAETLLLIATSHFEPDITAYDTLLARVRNLDRSHRLSLALAHSAILGCHLRFGLEVTCAGSVSALRDDNVPDYPWLCEAVATLLEAYASEGEIRRRGRISEALLLGLIPDPQAFIGSKSPASLASSGARLETVRELFAAHRTDLLRDFEAHRPGEKLYSPFSFTFNFPHNLVKGAAVDAVLRGAPWGVPLDDLLIAPAAGTDGEERHALATTLMRYALASPDTINGRPHPAIVYHPEAGRRAFDRAITTMSQGS